MAANKDLIRFVREALNAGRTRAEISQALSDAGWTLAESREALGAWSETAFVPPIPRPQTMVSARDFFIYALTFGVLVVGASYLVVLGHNLIDLFFDDGQNERVSFRNSGQIRWAMAVLIVTTPTYLWLTLRERAKLAQDPSLYRSGMRKWLTYIALLIASCVLLGDLVAVIYALLNGDLTGQFIAKAGVVAVVAGGVFLYYQSDIRKGEEL